MSGLGFKNPRVQQLRRLSRRRSARLESGAFVLEGPVVIGEAFVAGVHLDTVFVDEKVDEQPWAAELLDEARRRGVEVVRLAPGVLANALETVTPWPIAAVLPLRATPPADVLDPVEGLVVVCAGIGDPGNAGTIIRSAEALGSRGVVFADPSVDVHNPKVVRSSAGSLLRLPVAAGGSAVELVDRCRSAGWLVRGLVVDGGLAYDEVDLTAPTVIVVGNEAHGLDDEVVASLSSGITIPMAGRTESLNAAMAATVVLAEAARQRRHRLRLASGGDR